MRAVSCLLLILLNISPYKFPIFDNFSNEEKVDLVQFDQNSSTNAWTVFLRKDEYYLDTIFVFKNKSKKVLRFKTELMTHSFIEAGIFYLQGFKDPFLITKWVSGAHGEAVFVFSLEKYQDEALPLYIYRSAWPLDFKIENNSLIIIGRTHETEKGTNEPLKEKRIWIPDR